MLLSYGMTTITLAVILQLALSLLVSAQTNPSATVEQKAQALQFASQAVVIAQEFLASPVAQTTVVSTVPVQSAPVQTTPVQSTGGSNVVEVSKPIIIMPTYLVEVEPVVYQEWGGVLKFKVTKDGKPVEKIETITSNLTYQTFTGAAEVTGEYSIRLPIQVKPASPILALIIEGEKIETAVEVR